MPIGKPFLQLDAIDSTNNYAMAKVQAQLADHGTVWFAHRQTNGKGQRGKDWISGIRENIIMSAVIDPVGLRLHQQFVMSALMAVACRDFFDRYANGLTKIKWPNDLYWKDRKAGGILIENVVQGKKWKYAIGGVGININQVTFPDQVTKAVSLKQITGTNYNVVKMSKELCVFLDQRYMQVCDNDVEGLLADYRCHLYKLNEKVTFKKENVEFTARVSGVSNNGELLLDMGEPTSISIGQVQWVIS